MSVGDDELDRSPWGGDRRPVVRLSAIGDAWGLFLQRWPVWVLATLIVLLCNSAVSGCVYSLFRVPHAAGAGGFRVNLPPGGQVLQVVLSAVVNGFFLGGMFRMATRQVRGQSVGVEDLFRVTDVLPELILGSVLYALASFVAYMLCVVPGLIVSALLMFTIPLIVDGRLRATDAMRQSWRALSGQWLTASLVHLVFYLVAGVGTCLCCVGLLVTAPLYSLSISVLYRDFFLAKASPPGAL
jgi:hypothetical protein